MIQFRVSRLFGLRVDADGVLIPGEDGLQLVFNRADGDQGLLDVDVQAIKIAWNDLETWQVAFGWLSDRISLTLSSIECLRNLPGVKENKVDLVVLRRHRDALKQFQRRAKEYESGQRVDNVDETIDEIRDFLQDM